MEKVTYTPVDCGFYDLLELASMRREYVEFVYLNDAGEKVETKAFIDDLWAKNGEEFAKLHDGTVVRLDKIVQLDSYYTEAQVWSASCACK